MKFFYLFFLLLLEVFGIWGPTCRSVKYYYSFSYVIIQKVQFVEYFHKVVVKKAIVLMVG